MKRFRFSLEAALDLRRHRAESEEAALLKIRAELAAIRDASRALEAEVEAERRTPTEFLDALDRYRAAANRKLAALAAEAAKVSVRVDAHQRRVIEARRDVELLLKLRDKARAAWRAGADKELQEIADEAYLSGWSRRP
jgi:flagellar biosynthesis chaperone FliJ